MKKTGNTHIYLSEFLGTFIFLLCGIGCVGALKLAGQLWPVGDQHRLGSCRGHGRLCLRRCVRRAPQSVRDHRPGVVRGFRQAQGRALHPGADGGRFLCCGAGLCHVLQSVCRCRGRHGGRSRQDDGAGRDLLYLPPSQDHLFPGLFRGARHHGRAHVPDLCSGGWPQYGSQGQSGRPAHRSAGGAHRRQLRPADRLCHECRA